MCTPSFRFTAVVSCPRQRPIVPAKRERKPEKKTADEQK